MPLTARVTRRIMCSIKKATMGRVTCPIAGSREPLDGGNAASGTQAKNSPEPPFERHVHARADDDDRAQA